MPRPRTTQAQSRQSQSGRSRLATNESSLCQFSFADGRRCRMLRIPSHPDFCYTHARADLQEREANRLGAELAQTLTGNFMTATDVNHALGRLYTAVARGQIDPRRAASMAYIAQLLLQSTHAIKSEFNFTYSFDQWLHFTSRAKPLSLSALHSASPTPSPCAELAPSGANFAGPDSLVAAHSSSNHPESSQTRKTKSALANQT